MHVSIRGSFSRLRFVFIWTLLTTVAWVLFIPLLVFGGEFDFYLDFWVRPESRFVLLLIYLGIALIIGTAQWFALRKYFSDAHLWIVATSVGTVLGVLASFLFGSDDWPIDMAWIAVAVALLQGVALVPSLGRKWLWWLFKAPLLAPCAWIGFMLGFLLAAIMTSNASPVTMPLLTIVGFVLLIAPAGLFFGLATGILLAVLVARRWQPEASLG